MSDKDYKPLHAIDGGSADYTQPIHEMKAGEELNLIKKDPALKRIVVGVGWDFRALDVAPPDLDSSVLLLDRHNQTRADEDFVFYNNRMGGEGSVRHLGDSRTGAGDGDDEQIEINLATMPFEIMKASFVISVYDLDMGLEGHDFSMVRNVYFRVVNQDNGHEIFRFNISEDMFPPAGDALLVGELERIGNEWFFYAKSLPLKGGLGKFARECGIIVAQNLQS